MKKTVKINGMTCHSCEALLTDVLEDLPSTKVKFISAKEAKAEIEFDESKTSLQKIQNVIEEEEYSVE